MVEFIFVFPAVIALFMLIIESGRIMCISALAQWGAFRACRSASLTAGRQDMTGAAWKLASRAQGMAPFSGHPLGARAAGVKFSFGGIPLSVKAKVSACFKPVFLHVVKVVHEGTLTVSAACTLPVEGHF